MFKGVEFLKKQHNVIVAERDPPASLPSLPGEHCMEEVFREDDNGSRHIVLLVEECTSTKSDLLSYMYRCIL